jgi:hypothetical protein
MDRELELKLAELRERLPALLLEHPNAEDFYHAFSEGVAVLTAHLKAEDEIWFEKQIALMLAEFGQKNR